MKESSLIHIIAPAGAVNKKNVKGGIKFLSSLGFSCIPGSALFNSDGYLAGTDADRLNDIQTALNDSGVLAVWAARGGYGTTRIIDQIKWNKFFKKPSWLIGFSDITALHIHLSNNNIPSIHGPMVGQAVDEACQESVRLVGSILKNDFPEYKLTGHAMNRPGKATGPITGGNLTLICATLGTATEIITDNKILFIEDINEPAYKIDRMMVQLKRAGKLSRLKGLIVGHMTEVTDEKQFGKTVFEIITEHTKDFSFPVCFQFPAGHEMPNMPLILGMKSELTVEKKRINLCYL
ncbi:MAG: S66 peptidase family protein [Cytophaga sp.]|uniref:S66 peptidase family protein n=1 Tax=Cytophaga sp. TaxID=29535 RepID=UPI003F7ED34C